MTGAWERSRIARGSSKVCWPWPIRNASTAAISESAAVCTHSPNSFGSKPVEGMPSRPNRDVYPSLTSSRSSTTTIIRPPPNQCGTSMIYGYESYESGTRCWKLMAGINSCLTFASRFALHIVGHRTYAHKNFVEKLTPGKLGLAWPDSGGFLPHFDTIPLCSLFAIFDCINSDRSYSH